MSESNAEAMNERTKLVIDREGAVTAREGTATRREEAAGVREDTAVIREDAAGVREVTSTLREDAVHIREEAAQAKTELETLLIKVREVNERLVLATVAAQSMTEVADRANHLKDEFLATVSHELRTPLNAILGWARMLSARQLAPDRAEAAVLIIERNAVALARIIEDLLDVSRIVAGTLQMAPQPVDLLAVARAALDSVRTLASDKGVELALTTDPASIEPVSADPSRLQQAFSNVFANAIKFTPAGGRVDIFVEPAIDHMEVRVVDTGQGISPDFLPHVFERFRQADGATTRRHSGLGLGLAIVRQLVEMHGGSVEAASAGVGRGATFTIRLPVAVGIPAAAHDDRPADRRIAADSTSPSPRTARLDGMHVLVIDDKEEGRALTALVLTQAGARVTGVAAVGDALEILEHDRPDAIVSDIGMPDQDGFALIREVRRREAERGGFVPAVALTGYARTSDRTRILAAGFQAHLTKPLDPAGLTSTIATLTAHPEARTGDQT